MTHVYTDGACSNNGFSQAKSGIGIFFGIEDERNVSECITGKQTNNTAELSAVIRVFDIMQDSIASGEPVFIHTDSAYVILCATSYGSKLAQKNWQRKKPIPNVELVKTLFSLYQAHTNVKLLHVQAHTGRQDKHSIGNDWADRLANAAIGVESCPYQSFGKNTKKSTKPNMKKSTKTNTKTIVLNVPYTEKDQAKRYGARWNRQKKTWYVPVGVNGEYDTRLEQWMNL